MDAGKYRVQPLVRRISRTGQTTWGSPENPDSQRHSRQVAIGPAHAPAAGEGLGFPEDTILTRVAGLFKSGGSARTF